MLSPLASLPSSIVLFLQIDDLTAELETASSKRLHLDAKNQVLREELLSMKGMQKKCEKLEKNKKKLEQEVVNLRSHIEMNVIERSQVEQYKRETGERARQDLIEKLKEVNLFCRLICSSVMCLSSPHCKLHFGSKQLMCFLYFP